MSTIRVIDYVANPGGGVRFAVETLRAMHRRADIGIQLVSSGASLGRYRELLKGVPVEFADVPPGNAYRTDLAPAPFARSLRRLHGILRTNSFHYDVPARAMAGGEVVWFPWVHRHRLTSKNGPPIVGSLHDTILLDHPKLFPGRIVEDERETLPCWLAGAAEIVVSSNATASRLAAMFPGHRRVRVVPLSGEHQASLVPDDEELPGDFARSPFLLCPANTAPHKNHEVLLMGVGLWARMPVVLTGSGTRLAGDNARGATLLACAASAGLALGSSLIGLGYVADRAYYTLLRRAWALVMPTIAEGGGSFPVIEAMALGIPVVCSDIPVMREMVERVNGTVTWFDPNRPEHLADRLKHLSLKYAEIKQECEVRAKLLRQPTWDDVAVSYLRAFADAAARNGKVR